MLSHTLNGVPTIVKSPKFQRWIKLQRLTCIASHWAAHLRHRFQRFKFTFRFHSMSPTSLNLRIYASFWEKKPKSVQVWLYLFNYNASFWCHPNHIKNRRHHNLRVSLLDYRNCNNNHRFLNCEHTTGMLENHDRDMAWHRLSNEDYMQMNFKLK